MKKIRLLFIARGTRTYGIKVHPFIAAGVIIGIVAVAVLATVEIADFKKLVAEKRAIAEDQVYKNKIQTLEIELNSYKKEYEKVVSIRDSYRASIKEIVELLHNKDSYLAVGSPELSELIETDEVTLLTIRNIVATMQDDQRLLVEVKNYLNARREFIDSFPFAWPVARNGALSISSPFGFRNDVFGADATRFHQGIDIGGDTGEHVVATADGKVVTATYGELSGNLIVIEHKNDFTTRYAHMSKLLVKPGQKVQRGDTIGEIGSTGSSNGPHLHYEIRHNDVPIDPMNYLTTNY